jgi:hypothetical protein
MHDPLMTGCTGTLGKSGTIARSSCKTLLASGTSAITNRAIRASSEREEVLDALRDELRKRDDLPIPFDFDKPTSRTTDETITRP